MALIVAPFTVLSGSCMFTKDSKTLNIPSDLMVKPLGIKYWDGFELLNEMFAYNFRYQAGNAVLKKYQAHSIL